MSEKNNKKIEFKEWMDSQIKGNGENYSPNTINSYCSALNSKPQMLDGIEGKYKESIFSYEDVAEFEKLIPILKSAVNFDEVDESTNKAFSNAIVKYKEFLSDINLGHDGKWYPDESVYNPNITKEQRKELILDKEPSGLVNKFTTLLKSTRNLILTGAPGTGKTYLAKEIAAAMGCTENEIGFVQFHPSYDYTDFVEGLRPVSKDNCDNIGFERKDGVFKEFCKRALNIKPQNKKQLPLTSANGISFNDVYDSLLNDVKRGVITTYDRKYRTGKLSYDGSRIRYENGKTESDFNMKLMYDYYVENQIWDLSEYEKEDFWKLISQLTQGRTKTLDYVEYGWTLQQLLNRAKAFLNKGNKEIVVDDPIASDEVEINEETKPFVFIIDEINRGEISKIFGELFFSIDPGYRGEKGRVKTQYQNLVEEGDMFSDGFFVPENVYIIGTMNDIDRSVESMDFAFRRRFAFAEVKAEDNVKMLDELEVLGLKDDAINRMNRLNSAISKIEGLSSAYHIGASYFLKLKEYGEDRWEALWNYHLEGLLREYLRGMPNADEEMRNLENAYWGNESNTNNG